MPTSALMCSLIYALLLMLICLLMPHYMFTILCATACTNVFTHTLYLIMCGGHVLMSKLMPTAIPMLMHVLMPTLTLRPVRIPMLMPAFKTMLMLGQWPLQIPPLFHACAKG